MLGLPYPTYWNGDCVNDARTQVRRSKRMFRKILLTILLAGSGLAQTTGSIQGKVTDSSSASILGAVVTVQCSDGNSRTTVTDGEGAFQITSLPPGNYDVKISASGLSDWTSSNVPVLLTAESQPLLVVLEVAPAVTTVTVGLPPEELAEEQLKQETQQRVMGVIPNYFVAYSKNAAPLSPKQKLNLSFKTLIDPATFAAVGITAGIQQSRNSYHQFGQGSEGFGKRFGAAYGTAATNLLITSVVADSVFHQDPRYFYSGEGTKKQRAWYAIKSAFRAKGITGNGSLLTPVWSERSPRPSFQSFTILVHAHNYPARQKHDVPFRRADRSEFERGTVLEKVYVPCAEIGC